MLSTETYTMNHFYDTKLTRWKAQTLSQNNRFLFHTRQWNTSKGLQRQNARKYQAFPTQTMLHKFRKNDPDISITYILIPKSFKSV